jgi:hypothetical protein
VVWIERPPREAPARFDVGLRFTELSGDAAAQLANALAAED